MANTIRIILDNDTTLLQLEKILKDSISVCFRKKACRCKKKVVTLQSKFAISGGTWLPANIAILLNFF